MVNSQTLEGHWNQVRGAVLEEWGQITNDDLQKVQGNAERLVGVIQQKAGVSREKVEAFLDKAVQDSQSAVERTSEAARQASEAVREQYDQVADQVTAGYREAETAVRQRPAESVAVAFGAGLIAGVVTTLILKTR